MDNSRHGIVSNPQQDDRGQYVTTEPSPKRITIFDTDTRCHSMAELPPEEHIYEDYEPPRPSTTNSPKPSQVKKADVVFPGKSYRSSQKQCHPSQRPVPLSGIGAASLETFQSSMQFFSARLNGTNEQSTFRRASSRTGYLTNIPSLRASHSYNKFTPQDAITWPRQSRASSKRSDFSNRENSQARSANLNNDYDTPKTSTRKIPKSQISIDTSKTSQSPTTCSQPGTPAKISSSPRKLPEGQLVPSPGIDSARKERPDCEPDNSRKPTPAPRKNSPPKLHLDIPEHSTQDKHTPSSSNTPNTPKHPDTAPEIGRGASVDIIRPERRKPETPIIQITDTEAVDIQMLKSSPGMSRRRRVVQQESFDLDQSVKLNSEIIQEDQCPYVTIEVLRHHRESVIPGFIRTPTPEPKFAQNKGKNPFREGQETGDVLLRSSSPLKERQKRETYMYALNNPLYAFNNLREPLSKQDLRNSYASTCDGSEDDVFTWSDKEGDSDDGEDNEDEQQEEEEDNIYESVEVIKPVEQKVESMDKSHRVVNELMTTEETYVKKLDILLQTKHQTSNILGEDLAKKMFPFIDSIWQLHKNNILPHLRERLANWHNCSRIGDIMKTFAPFLKLYTDYVKNYDEAVKLVEQWNEKSPEFTKVLRSLQTGNQEVCLLKIHFEAHMLEPIQRVPRYELLLRQYLKHLDDNSNDRPDVEDALKSVSEAALHFEAMMTRTSKMKELSDIASQLDCPINIVHGSRNLVKRGNILKVNASSGKTVERHLFLFTDMLLICQKQPARRVFQPRYKVKVILDVEGMQIADGENLEVPNTFVIKTKKKAIELSTESADDKIEWQQKLWQVVGDHTRMKLVQAGAARRQSGEQLESRPVMLQLGKEAPVWVHNSQVTMCMLCARAFTTFWKKHHCRACGRVLCGQCSLHTARLEFDDMREHRVCDECYLALTDSVMKTVLSGQHFRARSNELIRHSGYVLVSTDLTKTWTRRWIEVHEGGVLYSFKAQQDICPMHSLSLATCDVHLCALNNDPKTRLIKLIADTKLYFLKEPDQTKLKKWWNALQDAIEDTYGLYRRSSPRR